MIKNEKHLLNFIKSNIKTTSKDIIRSIGDDCAVIRISSKKYFVITTDTSLLGPHFTSDYTPFEIGYKCLATNLSDIAAMGCIPRYIFMAITLPSLDTEWIKNFYDGINELTSSYNIALIGGDTNRGPLSISIQVIGVNKNKILFRNGAKVNDDIYVTGKVGCARAALYLKNKKKYSNEFKILKNYLHMPEPRINIGKDISDIANSCIDVSDGIAKDLSNLITSSNCGADVFINDIPTDSILNKVIPKNNFYEILIGGGEDYELCFTVPTKYRTKINKLSKKHEIKITKIGKVTKEKIRYFDDGKLIKFKFKGFDHFTK